MDGNHAAIVQALRKAGIAFQSTAQLGGGVPDGVAAFRGVNVWLEFKQPGEQPNAAQREWHATWPGPVFVVDSPEAAVLCVVEAARRREPRCDCGGGITIPSECGVCANDE